MIENANVFLFAKIDTAPQGLNEINSVGIDFSSRPILFNPLQWHHMSVSASQITGKLTVC